MNRLILSLVLASLVCNSNGILAQDTTYYNRRYVALHDSSNAEYYEVVTLLDRDSMRATVQQYYMSNKLKSKASYLDYKNSELDGYDTSYYESGELQRVARYTKDYQEGLHLTFYKNGQAKREEYYIEGVRTAGNCYTATGADTSYYEFEKFPQFPGGDDQLLRYFEQKIKYPPNARKKGIQGQVVISFVVTKTGSIDHVVVEKSVSKEIDDHCVEVIKSMPKWSAGEQDGEKVDVTYKLPFNFFVK